MDAGTGGGMAKCGFGRRCAVCFCLAAFLFCCLCVQVWEEVWVGDGFEPSPVREGWWLQDQLAEVAVVKRRAVLAGDHWSGNCAKNGGMNGFVARRTMNQERTRDARELRTEKINQSGFHGMSGLWCHCSIKASNSHHQENPISSSESGTKPFFLTGILGGGGTWMFQEASKYLVSWFIPCFGDLQPTYNRVIFIKYQPK